MVHVQNHFPKFMFQDMFRMRDFAKINNSKQYFFIGYYPTNSNLKKGPFYIGAFELIPKNREFTTYLILQNPYYCINSEYDTNEILNFKKQLLGMTNDASVFFKFNYLKDISNYRYYYSWLYEK